MIMWGGVGSTKTIKVTARNMEYCSLIRFLEPAVRNDSRGTLTTAYDFVWHPHTITSTFPLHLPQENLWVETTTAFHQYLLKFVLSFFMSLDRSLIFVLIGQLRGSLPPLRPLSYIGIIGGAWLIPQESSLKAPELVYVAYDLHSC